MSGKCLAIALSLASLWAGVPSCVLPSRAAEVPARSETNRTFLAGPPSDVLQFVDGSLLHGRLQSMAAGSEVGWENPEAKAPIQFRPTNLAWIRFEKPVAVTSQAKPTCRLRFNNGDDVFGKLTAIEEGK